MYTKSTLLTKLAKKFHELWEIEEQRDQAAHGYPLLLTVQAFLTTYVSSTMKDDQLKAMAGLHWMTTVAATKAVVEELLAQCTKTARATEGLSIEQKFRQMTLYERNVMLLAIAPSWAHTAQRKATADELAFSTWQGFFTLWLQLRSGLNGRWPTDEGKPVKYGGTGVSSRRLHSLGIEDGPARDVAVPQTIAALAARDGAPRLVFEAIMDAEERGAARYGLGSGRVAGLAPREDAAPACPEASDALLPLRRAVL